MKKYGVWMFVLVLVVFTGIAARQHLTGREQVAAGTVQIIASGQTKTVRLSELEYEPVSGVRVNGKGESIPVEGMGVPLKVLLEAEQLADCAGVTVIADDSYRAELTAEEVAGDGKVFLLLQGDTLRLVVFGDGNSRRSITNVVQIVVE